MSGTISSDPSISTVTHGLTEFGRQQVAAAAKEWYKQLPTGKDVVIISSDFTRARETAEEVLATLQENGVSVHPPKVILNTSLRERYFGLYNGKSTDHYNDVWVEDAKSADHTEQEVESVNAVVRRGTKLICQLENELEEIIAQAEEKEGKQHTSSSSSSSSFVVCSWLDKLSSFYPFRRSTHVTPSSSSSSSSFPSRTVILVAHGDVCQILATAFLNMDSRQHRSLQHWENGECRQYVWDHTNQTAEIKQ